MLQSERTWLFNVAYSLDNRRRIVGKTKQAFVVFTHEELEKLAEDLRKMAANDEDRLMRGVRANNGNSRSH